MVLALYSVTWRRRLPFRWTHVVLSMLSAPDLSATIILSTVPMRPTWQSMPRSWANCAQWPIVASFQSIVPPTNIVVMLPVSHPHVPQTLRTVSPSIPSCTASAHLVPGKDASSAVCHAIDSLRLSSPPPTMSGRTANSGVRPSSAHLVRMCRKVAGFQRFPCFHALNAPLSTAKKGYADGSR
jgi:hypothetical protein